MMCISAYEHAEATVSLEEYHLYELKARQRLGEVESRSGAVRQILDEYEEFRTECAQLKIRVWRIAFEYESRQNRIKELESQPAKRSTIEEEIEALPDKI